MRRVIYPDLGSMYYHAAHFLKVDTKMDADESVKWKKSRLETQLRFIGEKYAHEHREIYYQLSEYPHLETIYSALRSTFADDEYGFEINCGLAVEIIEDSVRLGWVPAKYIKKYMGKEDAIRLLAFARKPRP